tara:strand:+ start:2371 stop:2523 length:153 start_codon:yes stop_codon:yes gene_type:complete
MYFLGISVVTAALIMRGPLNNITKSIKDLTFHTKKINEFFNRDNQDLFRD